MVLGAWQIRCFVLSYLMANGIAMNVENLRYSSLLDISII
jgi:hypothetical protein